MCNQIVMYETINEPVEVNVSFLHHRTTPKRMKWQERYYDIKKVNLVHATREGTKKIFYFSVSDLLNYFKLKFDTETLEWRLVEIYTDG